MPLSWITAHSRPIVGLLAGALLVDLFLDWRRASVETPAVLVDAGSAAIGGWGALAGVALVVLLGAVLANARAGMLAGLAATAAGFVVIEFFTGSVRVDVAGAVSVDTTQRLWPAYVGLVLACGLVAAATFRLLEHQRVTAPLTGARPGMG